MPPQISAKGERLSVNSARLFSGALIFSRRKGYDPIFGFIPVNQPGFNSILFCLPQSPNINLKPSDSTLLFDVPERVFYYRPRIASLYPGNSIFSDSPSTAMPLLLTMESFCSAEKPMVSPSFKTTVSVTT